ncbi:hypothetical protein Tco_0009098 [Tanacetum coccineum]
MAYPRQDFTRKRVLTNSQYDVSFLSTYTISVKITIRRYTKSSKLGMISLIGYKHSTALTARKSVRPLPSHRLALRYTSHHLDHFTSRSSSSHSSSDHSSSGHSISGHSLSGHTSPDTTIADSSTPPRFVNPPLARTLQCKDACLHWRSPAATVTLSIHAIRVLVPSRADLLPPRKRFKDSISLEDSVEEDIDPDVLEDIEADATTIEVEDEVESSDRGTMEVGVDVAARIDIPDAMLIPNDVEHLERLESRNLIAGGERERVGLLEEVASLERSNARLRGTMMMERARADRRLETFVARHLALAAYKATRDTNVLEAKSQSQNGSDSDNGNSGNGNGGDGNGGDGNGNGENGNLNENNRGARPVAQECTYQDFMNNCPEKYQVKYATCTQLNSELTWWNSHKSTIGTGAAFAMTWRELMKLMAKNNDLAAYTQRFQELTMMCTKMVPEEEDQVEKFIEGFPAQSIRSSNTIALDSLYLLVLITGTSQSRKHESRKSPTKSLFDVGSRRISIITVNTKEYHSDVLAIITRIMRRTY